ncbi:hypothetical protein [Thermocrinis sp.]
MKAVVDRLIFHVGFHKTGTSSIQAFLYRNRDKLFKDAGIYYPNTYGYLNHLIYISALTNSYGYFVPNELRFDIKHLLKQLDEEVKAVGPKVILISAEDFIWYLEKPKVEKLKVIVECINPKILEVIIYLRRQDKILESIYGERIKCYNTNGIPSNPLSVDFPSLQYYNFLKNLEDIFKDIEFKLTPRIYLRDFYKDWDVVKDFCEVIGIPKHHFTNEYIEANISLSPTSTEALKRIMEKYMLSPELHNKIVSSLYEYERLKPSRIKVYMSLEDRKRVLDFYRGPNEKLFTEYFNQENLFTLSQEEEEFYEEQERIKAKEFKEEVEEKYKNILAILKNESVLERKKIYAFQKYSYSDLMKELIKGGLVREAVRGNIDVVDEEKIEGWLLDLEDEQPFFLLKINDVCVYIGTPDLEREDIELIYGVNVNAGFRVFWKNVNIPDSILALPNDAELEIEVVHERTGLIISGKRMLKKQILMQSIRDRASVKIEIKKRINTGLKNIIYLMISSSKAISLVYSPLTNAKITYIANGRDWNMLCIVPKGVNTVPMTVRYLDGSEETTELKL